MSRETTEYVPDKAVSRGWLSSWLDMASEFPGIRRVGTALFLRDFKALYRQSALGYFWAVFTPLLTVATFVYLNGSGLLSVGPIEVPYVVYAVAGVAFWQLFSIGVTTSTQSLVASGNLLTKVNFPRESLVFAAYAMVGVPFVIQFGAAVALMLGLSVPLHWGSLLAIPAAVPLVCFALAWGLLLSLLNGLFRDVGAALPSIMQFLLFLTPVMYVKPAEGFAATLATYNPLYYLVVVPRDLLLFGTVHDARGYFICAFVSVFLLALAWELFHLTETRLAERI